MEVQTLQTQQLQLLAKKALLNDEVKKTDEALGQISAILQFAEAQAKAAAPAAPQEARENTPV